MDNASEDTSHKTSAKVSFLVLVLVCDLGVLFSGYLGRFHYLLDLASHFRVYVSIVCVLCTVFLWWFRARKWAAVGTVIALYLTGSLLVYYLPKFNRANETQGTYRLIAFNVLTSNSKRTGVVDYLRKRSPDIILLQEVNAAWVRAIDNDFGEEWPYRIRIPREDNFGIALYSRYPLQDSQTLELDQKTEIPSICTMIQVNDSQRIRFVGTHPLPPVSKRNWLQRNATFVALAALVKTNTDIPTVVAGDLNCTPWSVWFTEFLNDSGLNNAMEGQGLPITWRFRHNPWLGIPIDQTLINDRVVVSRRSVGPYLGSDHLPVELDFLIK